MSNHKKELIELLAPAGNWECARAAVENGANAIYFGLDVGFNARARAANFHLDELQPLMKMLHRQAVRGYVTLNTLVFTDELPELETNVRQLAEAGVDAVLVQDLGVARLIRRLVPDLEIHASTQMTLTNAQSMELVAELGIARAVLARELSLKEIRQIASKTSMPLEAFVHGALCVAYSGQCLTSESFGGRSANRGQCAQACRLPYDLYCDGERQELGDVKYLLSPQDLAAHDLVSELIKAGVTSLKIEGRLKTPEYVANVCSQYRQAIDAAIRNQPRKMTVDQQRDLEMSFSRGFSPGWLEGCDHKRLVPGKSSAKRGTALGKIVDVRRGRLVVRLEAPLAIGDGIVVEGDRFAGKEIGSRVYQIFEGAKQLSASKSGVVEIGLQHGVLGQVQNQPERLAGLQVWKTDDPQLNKRLRKTFDVADPVKRVPVEVHVEIHVDQPISIQVRAADTEKFELVNEYLPQVARKHPISESVLHEQFSRLGKSVYRLESLTADLDANAMVPLSVLGKLRRAMIDQLDARRLPKPHRCLAERVAVTMLNEVECPSEVGLPDASQAADTEPSQLRVLCRSLKQVEQVLDAGVGRLIVDFHDIREYRQAVQIVKERGTSIEIATLRIHKPGEDGVFRALAKHAADGWLVRNLAAIEYCRSHAIPFACDFSLNVTNPLTAQQLTRWGAGRVTASYDLNRDQLFELTAAVPARWMEVVIHQHMPMFHMEHCVFCSVLSPGRNKTDCGRPCDRHEVELKDRTGTAHVLHADIGCRNTLYNGTAQSGAEAVGQLMDMGVRQFRVELLKDAGSHEIRRLVGLYSDLLRGSTSGTEVWKQLKADNRIGVTRGTLEQPRNPLAIL